jgi:hypothetical protein
MHATTEELLGAVFSIRSVPRLHSESRSIAAISSRQPARVEAGSNTSTVTLRVVGDEKGSFKAETAKYGH